MAYEKNYDGSLAIAKIILGVVCIIGLVAIIAIVLVRRGTAPSEPQPVAESVTTGRIANFSTNENAVAGANTEPTELPSAIPAEAEQPDTQSFSDAPMTMNLPVGWTQTGQQTLANECEPDITDTVTTFQNGDETITVYENGSPVGCDNSVIGDVYYDFNFARDGGSITVDTSTSPAFCTPEDSPTCPKGDGKVTVFVGNAEVSTPADFTRSSKTDKTYFFVIEDTGLEDDLLAQSKTLAQLAASIQIN